MKSSLLHFLKRNGLHLLFVLSFLLQATIALGQDRIVRLVRSSAEYVNRISGVVLVGAGLFIVWYWVTVLSSGSIALADSGLVRWVDGLSASITSFVRERPFVVAATLLVVVVTAVLTSRTAGDDQPVGVADDSSV